MSAKAERPKSLRTIAHHPNFFAPSLGHSFGQDPLLNVLRKQPGMEMIAMDKFFKLVNGS